MVEGADGEYDRASLGGQCARDDRDSEAWNVQLGHLALHEFIDCLHVDLIVGRRAEPSPRAHPKHEQKQGNARRDRTASQPRDPGEGSRRAPELSRPGEDRLVQL